jgi:hypothetical protein
VRFFSGFYLSSNFHFYFPALAVLVSISSS